MIDSPAWWHASRAGCFRFAVTNKAAKTIAHRPSVCTFLRVLLVARFCPACRAVLTPCGSVRGTFSAHQFSDGCTWCSVCIKLGWQRARGLRGAPFFLSPVQTDTFRESVCVCVCVCRFYNAHITHPSTNPFSGTARLLLRHTLSQGPQRVYCKHVCEGVSLSSMLHFHPSIEPSLCLSVCLSIFLTTKWRIEGFHIFLPWPRPNVP
mmetsp:Transcript_50687/g.127153  ORF Transcript_50687/g.127153 Transcript_50687/m.127153 type:complete len:207 (+) Transcript_50687:365-985(+)